MQANQLLIMSIQRLVNPGQCWYYLFYFANNWYQYNIYICNINNNYNGSVISENCFLNILNPLLNTNSENGFMTPYNNKQSEILGEINNLPMKLYPNLFLIMAQIFDKFIPLFEQVIPCSVHNCITQVIFQIQYYFVDVNTSYGGSLHGAGYVEGEYIDGGGIHVFYKTLNVFTQDVYEIMTDPGKKSQIKIKQGRCIIFENSGVNHGLKTLTDKNKDDSIGKRTWCIKCGSTKS